MSSDLASGTYWRVSDYLHHWSSVQPSHVAFYFQEKSITYCEFEQRAELLACYLLEYGVRKGDRIVYLLSGSPEFFFLYMAAAMIGATVVGAGLRYPPSEISRILDDTKPRLIICHEYALDRLLAVKPENIPVISVGDTHSNGLIPFESCTTASSRRTMSWLQKCQDEVSMDDPLFILYTSGTTGTPKGAVFTHRNLISSALMQAKEFGGPGGCTPEDIFQHQVPVDHISGAVEWGVTPIIAGCASILAGGFDARRILENTQRYRATILAGVPTMWSMMFSLPDFEKYDLSSVRWCMTGAAPAPQTMLERMLKISPYCANPLGLTETSGFCTYTAIAASAVEMAATVGRVAPMLSYKVVDKHRKPVSKGTVGQLAYKGPSVIETYFQRLEGTTAAIDNDGYFCSGDLACEDHFGNIYLRGRNDEMFITAGYNVYPLEVETALLNHPGVHMAVVLPIPDTVMGMVGRAYILPKKGANLNKHMLRNHLLNLLEGYKIPRSYILVERLPLTALGKPQKAVLANDIAREFGYPSRKQA